MILILSFMSLSVFALISLAFIGGHYNKKKYMSHIERKLALLGFKLLTIDSVSQINILEESNSGLFNLSYGSSLIFKLYKKITFKSLQEQNLTGFVEIRILFFMLLSVKLFDEEMKPLTL
ncbi:hypothetical protein GVN16_10045 [Emticicia sp. CRIBPO]|uniref:hypothetical protein n=1 Tax=Emticicia sp. CRIBPO TaxID=2683258 RepID=UPI001412F05C|nr:hypothetical protein [Emticicia sp. CRIBPO]NBA86102.1 hypothetical protein [Emticicia sp. CRIBPO]